MNQGSEPPQEPAARPASAARGPIGRAIVRSVIWFGVFVAAVSLILIGLLPPGPSGGFGLGRFLPPPTLDTFAAVIVMIFSIVGMASLTRPTAAAQRSGIVAYALVLAIGAAALWWLPQWSGIIAAGALAVLVVIPFWLMSLSRHYALAGSRKRAATCWNLAAGLHPSRAMRAYGGLLRARALASCEAEIAAYAALKRGATAEQAALLDGLTAFARDDWTGVLDRSRGVAALKAYEIRALGELGRTEEMIATFAAWQPKPRGGELDLHRLAVLAFAGRVDGVRALLRRQLRSLQPERAAYWSFVAANAAGIADDARSALTAHAHASDDESFRRAAQRQLAAARPTACPPHLSAHASAVIAEIETAVGRPTR